MTLYQIFSYAIRVRCPNRPVRASSDMAGSFRESQPPCRVRRARDCAPYRARFLTSVHGTTARRRRYANFSSMTDAVGRIRRYQRSTCVTAALPAPKRGRKKDFSPSNSWNDSKTAVLRQTNASANAAIWTRDASLRALLIVTTGSTNSMPFEPSNIPFIVFAAIGAQVPFSISATVRF